MSGQRYVAVVVVRYGDPELALRCLRHLHASRGVSVRAVVADNGPHESDLEPVFRDAGAEWLPLDRNRGFAGGANAGLRRVCADSGVSTALVVNADVRVGRGCLAALDAVLQSDRAIGIAGPILLDHGSPRRCWNAGTDVEWPAGRPRSRLTGEPPPPRSAAVGDVDFVCGAVLAFRPDVFARVGGLDEDYFLYYEDADLSFRARRAGLRTVVVPNARAWHVGGASFDGREALGVYCRVRSRLLFSARWSPRPLRGRIARAVFATRALVTGTGRVLSGRITESGALVRGVIDHWRGLYGTGGGWEDVEVPVPSRAGTRTEGPR